LLRGHCRVNARIETLCGLPSAVGIHAHDVVHLRAPDEISSSFLCMIAKPTAPTCKIERSMMKRRMHSHFDLKRVRDQGERASLKGSGRSQGIGTVSRDRGRLKGSGRRTSRGFDTRDTGTAQRMQRCPCRWSQKWTVDFHRRCLVAVVAAVASASRQQRGAATFGRGTHSSTRVHNRPGRGFAQDSCRTADKTAEHASHPWTRPPGFGSRVCYRNDSGRSTSREAQPCCPRTHLGTARTFDATGAATLLSAPLMI
jgi:hypothetical protein